MTVVSVNGPDLTALDGIERTFAGTARRRMAAAQFISTDMASRQRIGGLYVAPGEDCGTCGEKSSATRSS